MNRSTGAFVIAIGLAVVVVGVLISAGALSWFGRLPGDIRIEGERSRVYIPITSGILASIVLTVLVNVVGRWLR